MKISSLYFADHETLISVLRAFNNETLRCLNIMLDNLPPLDAIAEICDALQGGSLKCHSVQHIAIGARDDDGLLDEFRACLVKRMKPTLQIPPFLLGGIK